MIDFETLVLQVGIFEGFRKQMYFDVNGIATIGYGFTSSCFDDGVVPTTIRKDVADEMLRKIVLQYKQTTEKRLSMCDKLTDTERKALLLPLTDFAYNCGYGNLCKLTEQRDYDTILSRLPLYCKAGTKVLKGLQKRREWEVNETKTAYAELTKTKPQTEKTYTVYDVQTLLNTKGYHLTVDGIAGKATCKAIITELNAMR